MGNGISVHEQPGGSEWWVNYCRQDWRSLRSKQLDELLGLQRPPLKRGLSSSNLDELVKKLTQDPIPLLTDTEDTSDLKSAIAKLNNGGILHTEKRAIERLLAQRYEDALAIAAAAAEHGNGESLGGASDVLRQILAVFRQNNLPTELDRSVAEEPAEWRIRSHKLRRRAFLVVRSMVRLKREVKRLGEPIHDLGWLLPVAAQERWGEVKALAARYRQLEATLQDTEIAVAQLTQLREAHVKSTAPTKHSTGGRASPQRPLRTGAGRMSGTGTSGRAVSESGAVNSRARHRAALTADPPPPPVAGVRGGRRNGSGTDAGGGPASAPLYGVSGPGAAHPRMPLNGRKGGAGGSDTGAGSGGGAAPTALIPSISAQRVPGSPAAPMNGLYNPRLSVSGGSASMGGLPLTPPGLHGGSSGGILSAMPPISPNAASAVQGRMSAPGAAPTGAPPTGSPRGLLREHTLTRTGAQAVRQSFTGSGDGAPSGGPLFPSVGRVAQILDLTTVPHLTDNTEPAHVGVAAQVALAISPDMTVLASPTASGGTPQRKPQAPAEVAPNGNLHRCGPGRTWGVTVEPQPPTAPPPTAGARRPLGPLSHSSPSPLSGLAPPIRPVAGTADGALSPGAAAPSGPVLPVLIQDGESLDQALARFKLLADDTRCALVDTARQFRALLDLCNSCWPDQRWWLPAHTHEEAALDTWPASDEFIVNRADVVRCLKAGAVTFQFMCSTDEPLVGPTGNRFDWWTSDPWEVAADLAPERVLEAQLAAQQAQPPRPGEKPPERMVGMPLGVRVLQQLANRVAELAGPQALEALPVILHISERQQENLGADLLQYGIYRRLRRNLFIVVQPSHPVMRYSPEANAFQPATDQPTYTPGTGFSMLQLLWPGHALFLNDAGDLERLPHSIMQELRKRNTEWFVSRTCQDLSLLVDDGALDLRTLSHVSYMWNTPHLRYSVAVEAASTYVKHRDMVLQYGSVLLCRKPKVTGMVLGRLDGAVRLDRYTAGSKPQLPVVELLACELNSAHMQHELNQIANTRAAATSVGIGRYVFRFEVLSSLLTGPTVLRPKLLPVVDLKALLQAAGPGGLQKQVSSLDEGAATAAANNGAIFPFPTAGGLSEHQLAFAASQGLDTVLLRLHLSMTDLTMHHASRVVALKAHRAPIFVRGPEDGQQLVELLSNSDLDLRGAAQRLAAKLPSFSRHQKPGQNILVFVQDNSVSLTATNVAAGLVRRERNDRIHLVTVVPTEAQRGEAAALLDRLMKAFRTSADVLTHVLSQEGRGLLECVADVVTQHHCGLLVVGSTAITAVASVIPRNSPVVLPGAAMKPPGTAMGGSGAAGGAGRGGAFPLGTAQPGGAMDESTSEMLVSSVALSILRTFSLPVILVTANTKTYLKRHSTETVANGGRQARLPVGGVGGATTGRLAVMAVVERHSRPMMHHLVRSLLEPSLRQDVLTLTQVLPPGMAQGNAGYDATCIQAVALKTLMANFESIAAANDFHTPVKVLVQGDWYSALCIAARDYGTQLLSIQLAPGSTRSLPPALLQLVRSAPCPVLIYPERVIVPGSGIMSEGGRES